MVASGRGMPGVSGVVIIAALALFGNVLYTLRMEGVWRVEKRGRNRNLIDWLRLLMGENPPIV